MNADFDEVDLIRNAGQKFIEKFSKLGKPQTVTGYLRGEECRRYLMYKLDPLTLNQGVSEYEFLIEYDTYLPSQGIYFGCKEVTLNLKHHFQEIERANKDWEELKPVILQRLNNTFIDKDFTQRFNKTDNFNDGTYWPFWISLHEDEDIEEIGLRALKIIYAAYKDFLTGTTFSRAFVSAKNKKNNDVKTSYTEDAYRRLENTIKKNIKEKIVAVNTENSEETGWCIFNKKIETLTSEGVFHPNTHYEKAWCLDNRFSDVDFKAIITSIFKIIENKLNIKHIKIPWNALIGVFMRHDESPYKIQIKTLLIKESTETYWMKSIL